VASHKIEAESTNKERARREKKKDILKYFEHHGEGCTKIPVVLRMLSEN